MTPSLANLLHQRGQLVERIAHQRATLARELGPVQSVLNTADRATAAAREGVQYLKENPLPVVLTVTALVLLRPRRAWRWLGRGLLVWRSWRALTAWVPPSLLQQAMRQAMRRYF